MLRVDPSIVPLREVHPTKPADMGDGAMRVGAIDVNTAEDLVASKVALLGGLSDFTAAGPVVDTVVVPP